MLDLFHEYLGFFYNSSSNSTNGKELNTSVQKQLYRESLGIANYWLQHHREMIWRATILTPNYVNNLTRQDQSSLLLDKTVSVSMYSSPSKLGQYQNIILVQMHLTSTNNSYPKLCQSEQYSQPKPSQSNHYSQPFTHISSEWISGTTGSFKFAR